MFLADVVGLIAEKAKISGKLVFSLINQLDLLNADDQFQQIIKILTNFSYYGPALRIFNTFI